MGEMEDSDHDDEQKVCWQCSTFSNVFPELMSTIEQLKKKRRRTNEDTIIKSMISKDNNQITCEDTINDVFLCRRNRNKREYNGDYSYKISNETQKYSCESCDEIVSPFDCNNYTMDENVKYRIIFFTVLS